MNRNGGDGADGDQDDRIHVVGPRTRAKAWEREMMAKVGWYAHFVTGEDPQTPTGFNAHTHGFTETWGQPDVQIVMPMPPETAHGVMISIANLLKAGVRLEPGREYDEILHDYKVMFAWAVESGRRVLRAILPDKEGNLERGNIAEPYARQWEGTEE